MYATNSKSQWRGRAVAAVIFMACSVAVLGSADLMLTLSSADRFFHQLCGLTPGKSSLTEAKLLLRYRSFATESVPCTDERCSIQFLVESRLSRWHLIRPRRGFLGFVDARNNVVETIRFSYAEDALMYSEATLGPSPSPQSRPSLPVGLYVVALSSSRHKSVAKVTQFADMPVDARTEILQPNVWCLVKLGGCQTPQSILPGTRSLSFEP